MVTTDKEETRRQTRRFNILLVEDNPADVYLAVEAMKESPISHSLSVVTDGQKAISYMLREGKYADAQRPDAVILDLNLPKKNGFQVLKEIKENPHLRCIPVIIMTTSSDQNDIRQACDLKANSYIVKPLNFERFVKVIHSIMDYWFTTAILSEE
jgi:chemotaxis family two-component system response regulator Rcp1